MPQIFDDTAADILDSVMDGRLRSFSLGENLLRLQPVCRLA